MRAIIALAGWSGAGEGSAGAAPPGASWVGSDAAGQPLVLAHLGGEGATVATNEDGSLRALFTGRLTNARELRTSLAARHAFAGDDDAEVVLHLYEERGWRCVQNLRGAFALVLWDERLGRLLLARDQLGLVPLFYVAESRRLAACSALAPLVGLPGVGASWDAAALNGLVTLGCVLPPATLYSSIRQLHPGELALWEGNRVRLQRYWQLTFPERRLLRPDTAKLFREQALETVRLRNTGGVAGFLFSGGLDAAALVALARLDHRLPPRLYTAAAGADDEELRSARLVAKGLAVEHVLVENDIDWPVAVEHLLADCGMPAGNAGSPVLALAAARLAADWQRQRGTPPAIALAGVGAEEVFGGSPPARDWQRIERYRRLPGLARELAELWARVAPPHWSGDLTRMTSEARLAPLEIYARAVSLFQAHERDELYTDEARETVGDARPWEPLVGLFADAVAAGAAETTDAIHHVELAFRLPVRAAAAVAAAAAVGVELRLPFADHRLAQLVASLPAEHRSRDGERQLLLREALADLLPRSVLARPHHDPGPSASAWRASSLRTLLEDTLSPSRLRAQGIFRPDTVARLIQEHEAGIHDHGGRLWTLMLVSRWLERSVATTLPLVRAAS